jgi:hypothetical protein
MEFSAHITVELWLCIIQQDVAEELISREGSVEGVTV